MATSRPYNLKVSEPIKKTIFAEDHLEAKIDMPDLVPAKVESDILRKELSSRRFEENGDGTFTRERGGVEVTINPDTRDVKISVEASEDKELPPDNPSPCSCRMQEKLVEGLTRSQRDDLSNAQKALQKRVTDRLEGSLGRLGCELEAIVTQVTKEALKVKAAMIGQIKSIAEDKKTGELTIVVAV